MLKSFRAFIVFLIILINLNVFLSLIIQNENDYQKSHPIFPYFVHNFYPHLTHIHRMPYLSEEENPYNNFGFDEQFEADINYFP